MSEISFTSDGFVDMDQFDGSDPDAFTSLSDLDTGDAVPVLGDEGWGEILGNTFDPDFEPEVSLDHLLDDPSTPFDVDDDASDSPFDIDEMWGGGGNDDGGGVEDLLADVDLDDADLSLHDKDVDSSIDGDDDVDLDDDTGSTVGHMVDFDDSDVGSTVGGLVDFDDDVDVDVAADLHLEHHDDGDLSSDDDGGLDLDDLDFDF